MNNKLKFKNANVNINHKIDVFRRYRFNGEIYVKLCDYLDDISTVNYKLIKSGQICSEIFTNDPNEISIFKSQTYGEYSVVADITLKNGGVIEEKSHSIIILQDELSSQIKSDQKKPSLKGKLRIEQTENENYLKIMFKPGGLDKLNNENKNIVPIYENFKPGIEFVQCFSPDVLNKIIKRNTSSLRFLNFYKVISNLTNDDMLSLAIEIENLDYVEYCCLSPNFSCIDPPRKNLTTLDLSPKESVTPDFSILQGYLYDGLGMNVIPAWNDLFWSGLTTVCRVFDFGINKEHEDLSNITVAIDSRPGANTNHGTATSGCIAGESSNGIGIKGLVDDRCRLSFYDVTVEPTLGGIIADAQRGDIIVVNVSTAVSVASGRTLQVPGSHTRSLWDQIYECVNEIGAVVVLAAGNGYTDRWEGAQLDLIPEFNDWGDNGSSMISACVSTSGNLSSFSNSGSHVYMNSWGDSVVTTGYGDLHTVVGTDTRDYTAIYNGTSSATPLVGGALTLTQGYSRSLLGVVLDSYDMRELMRLTGNSNPTEIVSGRRPNVTVALQHLIDTTWG